MRKGANIDELAAEKFSPARAITLAALVLALASGLFAWHMVTEIDKAKASQEDSIARLLALETQLIDLSQEPPAEIDKLVVPEERAMEALLEVGNIMERLGIKREIYTDRITVLGDGLQKWRAVAVGAGTQEQALELLEEASKSEACRYVFEAFSFAPDEIRLEFSFYVYAEDFAR
jgi:hypothetical protein